ncbi:MAG: hypothetical protein L0287_18725 [Anaerolineae bacterium]|nr:hypothetical protein [Anaerolineae bacterium]MCI0706237.1 hypothetical protein [Ignavibacteriota bacterium]
MHVRKLGVLFVLLFLVVMTSYGQESVLTLLPFDGDTTKYINAQFVADTANTGGLLANRVYELERDAVYLTRSIITIQSGQTLRMRAAAGAGEKPIIYLWEQGSTNPAQSPQGRRAISLCWQAVTWN